MYRIDAIAVADVFPGRPHVEFLVHCVIIQKEL